MNSGGSSQPPVTGLLLVALVLGTVFFIEPPLHGSRPKDPPRIPDVSASEQFIPARLWQDPFEAIALHQPTATSKADANDNRQCSKLEDLFPQDFHGKEYPGVLLLMTPGSPYVEDGERRIRARYAVISALGVAGLSPRDSEHIGCTRTGTSDDQDDRFDMPFEWFTSRGGSNGAGRNPVLVAWLPEERFAAEPLTRLDYLVAKFRCLGKPTSIAVIGPQLSGTLDSLYQQLLKADKEDNDSPFPALQGVRFYSPSATMDEHLLSAAAGCPAPKYDACATGTLCGLYKEKVYGADDTQTPFLRTILSDSEVSSALLRELHNRGLELQPQHRSLTRKAWLRSTEPFFQDPGCSDFNNHRDHLVLISELDTLYGRSFPEAFIHATRDLDSGESAENPQDLRWIHRFSYLRGLDGQVPAKVRNQAGSASTGKNNRSTSTDKEALSSIKRAADTPRFDYLRRLAARVKRLDNELRKGYCGSIRAIGVLGSDVYDKLLILQALREKFSNTLFFTADMDARYLHPAEFQWTRNLIVASSHGLEPSELAFESDIPPFRDSYQTSRFLATLLAVSKHPTPTQKAVNDALMPVRVYEIGRTRARELTDRVSGPESDENSEETGTAEVTTVSWFQGSGSVDNKSGRPEAGTKIALNAVEIAKEGYLKVHDVQVRSRFEPLQSGNYPGHFMLTGSVLAVFLAVGGMGYYLRGYLGLHPVRFIHREGKFMISGTGIKTEARTDLHLAATVALLWASWLLLGVTSLSAFLGIGAVIVLTVVLGRIINPFREWILVRLASRQLPIGIAFLLFLAALAWAGILFSQEGWSPTALGTGEPFSWRDGISMWPGEIIRILAGIVAIGYMVTGWKSLREGDRQLTKMFFPSTKAVLADEKEVARYKPCARVRRIDWCCGKDKYLPADICKGRLDAWTDWIHYRIYRTLPERWNTVLFPATLFFLLGCVSIYWVDDFHVPYRGEFMHRFDHLVVFGFMAPSFLLLLFAVIDETSLCVGWVRRLTREFSYRTRTSYFLSHINSPNPRSNADRDLEEIWTRLQVVARRTRRVGNLIVGPFVVLFLVLVSQSPYFDNWDIPAGLIIVIAISAGYAIMCAIKLRRATEDARREAIRVLTQYLIFRGGKDAKIELLLSEIRKICDGGFLPWTRQPWLKAMLWLFSAFGIMSAEYISLGALG